MNKTVVMATNNADKLREAREILSPLGIEVLSQRDTGIKVEPVEDGTTFAENSEIKARAVFEALGGKYPVMADDSGIVVDALGGRPGVYSARYALSGEECTKLLSEMEGIPDEKRTARFVCNITFIDTEGKVFHAEGKVEGRVAHEMRGENGFVYDHIFLYGDKTTAELSPEEKNSISHRGAAMRALYKHLEERYGD